MQVVQTAEKLSLTDMCFKIRIRIASTSKYLRAHLHIMTPISSSKHLGTKVIQANGPAAITQVCMCVMKLNYSKTCIKRLLKT